MVSIVVNYGVLGNSNANVDSPALFNRRCEIAAGFSYFSPRNKPLHLITRAFPSCHATMAHDLHTSPPPHPTYILSYPAPYVLVVTINRPKAMNSLSYAAQWEADAIFNWFDGEPSLRVAIITGAGDKAFCAGQDLIEQSRLKTHPQPPQMMKHPFSGFAGISRRTGKKPILAAVNGFALGGGFEICLNW